MRQLIINAYDFSELSLQAKHNAYREIEQLLSEDFNVCVKDAIEEFKQELECQGYSDIEVFYSGFYSQGAGASFTAQHKLGKITKLDYRHNHEETMNFEPNEDVSDLKAHSVLHNSKTMARKLYERLERLYEAIMSIEYAQEVSEELDIIYDVNGRLIEE